MHDSKCELGLSRDDGFVGGQWVADKGLPTCHCCERRGLHVLGCDEYHAHKAPECCDAVCWCRPGRGRAAR